MLDLENYQYYLLLSLLGLLFSFGVFCFIRFLFYRDDMSSDGEMACIMGSIFLGIGCGIGTAAFLLNVDYSYNNNHNYHPNETSMFYDNTEVIIKYGEDLDQRYEITDKKRYDRIIDSCFYIESYITYDIFGGTEDTIYELITYDKNKIDLNQISIK